MTTKGELAADWGLTRADIPHLRLEMEPKLMSAEDRRQAAAALRQALAALRSRTK